MCDLLKMLAFRQEYQEVCLLDLVVNVNQSTALVPFFDVCQTMLKHLDVNVNARTEDGKTPLMLLIVWHSENASSQWLEVLLGHPDLDVNLRDSDNYSALSIAVERLHVDTVQCLLLRDDIDPTLHKTPLLCALEKLSDNKKRELVLQILELLAVHPKVLDLNVQYLGGDTVMHVLLGERKYDVIEKILAKFKANSSTPLALDLENQHGQIAFDLLFEQMVSEVENIAIFPTKFAMYSVSVCNFLICPRTTSSSLVARCCTCARNAA